MKEARAFSPCHITGFFQIVDQPADLLNVGSRGAGVSIRQGVETVVRIQKALRGSLEIRINGLASNSAEVSKSVVNMFLSRFEEMKDFEILVEHQVGVPIGAGFGTSGAAALSLALAINDVFGLGLSRIEAAQQAHVAEVKCKTGLGTVIAETFGGIEIRVKPGAPGIGEIVHVPVSEDHMVVCLAFNSLSTRKFLADEERRQHINAVGGELVDRLIKEPSVTSFLKLARQFAEQVGLLTEKIRPILSTLGESSFLCSMPIFGESVFTVVEKDSLERLLEIFRKCNTDGRIVVSRIDFEGARMLR